MMQVWGPTLQALHDVAILRAGAVPTREEILAWWGQVSLVRSWQGAVTMAEQIPYPLRIALGLGLTALGALLVWRSYRRATRPSQADVVRRVAKAAQAGPAFRADANAGGLAGLAGPDDVRRTAPNVAPAAETVSRRPRRALAPQAFLMADQYAQGRDPWAVPLKHDIVRIGRHQENDIRLEDKTVHRYHALLHRSPDGDFLIRDLSGEAGNGVYVNGSRIEQTALRPGDLVELGAVRLRFQQQLPS